MSVRIIDGVPKNRIWMTDSTGITQYDLESGKITMTPWDALGMALVGGFEWHTSEPDEKGIVRITGIQRFQQIN